MKPMQSLCRNGCFLVLSAFIFMVRPALAGLLPFPLSANQRGTVTCLENPSYAYDIYLPPAYSINGTPLPIFYTMYANGGGMVGTFQATCSSLNIIVVGITGTKNGVPWDNVMREIYAVTRDVRQRVLYDPAAANARICSPGCGRNTWLDCLKWLATRGAATSMPV